MTVREHHRIVCTLLECLQSSINISVFTRRFLHLLLVVRVMSHTNGVCGAVLVLVLSPTRHHDHDPCKSSARRPSHYSSRGRSGTV